MGPPAVAGQVHRCIKLTAAAFRADRLPSTVAPMRCEGWCTQTLFHRLQPVTIVRPLYIGFRQECAFRCVLFRKSLETPALRSRGADLSRTSLVTMSKFGWGDCVPWQTPLRDRWMKSSWIVQTSRAGCADLGCRGTYFDSERCSSFRSKASMDSNNAADTDSRCAFSKTSRPSSGCVKNPASTTTAGINAPRSTPKLACLTPRFVELRCRSERGS